MKKRLSFVVAATFLASASILNATVLNAAEPKRVAAEWDSGLKFELSVDETADAATGWRYAVDFGGGKIIDGARLGLTFKDEPAFGPSKIVRIDDRRTNEPWVDPLKNGATIENRFAEKRVVLQETSAPNRKLEIDFRVSDDGFAFRYVVDRPADAEYCVLSDDSEFAFVDDAAKLDVWASFYKSFNNSQEEFFQKKTLADVGADAFVGMPLIVRSERFIASLTEADLIDWPGSMFATKDGAPSTVVPRLTPRKDGRGAAVLTGVSKSPWRVAILGRKPVDVIDNAKIVRNLATPNVLGDVSWVEPGNASWDWWAPKGPRPMTTESLKEFVDFSAKSGWRYALVDAGWYKRTNYGNAQNDATTLANGVDIPALAEYAKSKNVRLILWFHWDDLNKAGVRETLERIASWGIAGAKIDFMDSQTQETVRWTTETCAIAAANKLIVDYHGMYKPTGFERTYPNQITREGVRGNEYNRWSALTSTHLTTLPFTRCALGPADFTPGGFLNEHSTTFKSLDKIDGDDATCRVVGTRAGELATCMLIDSPMRCFCDLPRNYEGQPGFEFLRDLPAAWDETIALDGEIGEFVVVARRAGDRWYLSAKTNEEARTITVPLSFLAGSEGAPAPTYEATVYADAPESATDARKIDISTRTFQYGDGEREITFETAPDGGWNAVFVPQK